MTITDIELYDIIEDYKTGAIQVFNNTQWVPGKILFVEYKNIQVSNDKIYVLGAIGVNTGVGQSNYCIFTDTDVLENDIYKSTHNTTVNVNGGQYRVLNDDDDTVVEDPFVIRKL